MNAPTKPPLAYDWYDTDLATIPYLKRFVTFLESPVSIYSPVSDFPLQRKNQDGIWLLIGKINNVRVALIWNDFRISGGSFGKSNANRMLRFIEEIKQHRLPLIIGINSMGVRISEGRTLFDTAFSLIPAIEEYKSVGKVYTIATGNCFGLGAILFGLGHYRIAIRDSAKINLTGPEVFTLFFGKSVDFDQLSDVATQNKRTNLVSEICIDLQSGFSKILQLLNYESGRLESISFDSSKDNLVTGLHLKTATPSSHIAAYDLLHEFTDGFIRLFSSFDDKLMVFLAHLDGQKIGVLINPLGNSDNMIGERTLSLYREALLYFRALKLPLLSILDTPGADPRVQPENYHILENIISVARLIYEYPHKKMGIGSGRCFGGACILSVPKIFGGKASYALPNTDVGIMHPKIITQLLSGSNRLLTQWQQSEVMQTGDLKDMIIEGSIDAVIQPQDIRTCIKGHLLQSADSGKFMVDAASRYLPTISRHPQHEVQGDHLS